MTEKSFLEILTEKIEKRILQENSQSVKQSNNETLHAKIDVNVDKSRGKKEEIREESAAEAAWISQIPLGKIHFSTPKQHVFGRVYPVNAPKPAPQKLSPPRKKHVLSELQKQAVVYFWAMQSKLQEDFTEQELKKAFRKLAHRLHPDRNQGQSQDFLLLKKHYQCLLSVFALENLKSA